jgi:ProP effector
MSNASLKEQLQAVASQLSDTIIKEVKDQRPKKKFHPRPQAESKQHQHQQHKSRPKPKWLDYVQYGVELLKAYFPTAFRPASDVKPLKKGIKQDLVKRLSTIEGIVTEDKGCMVKSLSYYVNTEAYHRSVVEGAPRIDLDGQSAGTVTAEEAKYSQERHQARLQAKKLAQKPNVHAESAPNLEPQV